MRTSRLGPLLAFNFLLLTPMIQAQQPNWTLQRDTTAAALLQRSVTSMATTAPSDSTATGNITIVEGSLNESGTINIQTLRITESSETITLPDGQRNVIYSNGDAKEVNGGQSANLPLELILVDQCADFPLPLLSAFLNDADESFKYIGQETLNGISVQHIQVWNSFASKPRLARLAPSSRRDVWLDSTSLLPVKISWMRQAGEGAVPAIPVEVDFSGYKNINGVVYPFQISKSYNGTPWQTITIQNVTFNTGLTDAQFQTE